MIMDVSHLDGVVTKTLFDLASENIFPPWSLTNVKGQKRQ